MNRVFQQQNNLLVLFGNSKKFYPRQKVRSLDDFLNFYLFINLFQLDITVALHRYILSRLNYELVFFGKTTALLVFEYLNSIHNVFNKFSKTAPAILKDDIESMKITLKRFAEIKKKYPQLKIIRNMITAHRHQNSFEYLNITSSIDSSVYIDLILDVIKVNTSLYLVVVRSLEKIDGVFNKHLPKR